MTPFPFDVVVFDLDGTLANTAPDLTAALNWMLARLGRSELPLEKVLTMIGRGVRVLVEQGLAATGPLTPGLADNALPLFSEHYELHLADRTLPYVGVATSLDRLRTRGAKLAICTNKPESLARKLITSFGWGEKFVSIVGGDTLPSRKPDARPLLEAINRCGGGKAVLIGDSIVDIETAGAANIPCVAVTFGFRDRPAEALGATRLIDRFDQLVLTLEKMTG